MKSAHCELLVLRFDRSIVFWLVVPNFGKATPMTGRSSFHVQTAGFDKGMKQ
jgi:hypothetical protein